MLLWLALACPADPTDTGCKAPATWFADADGDGFGDAEKSESACSSLAGMVADSTDCDDGDAAVHPGADESDCEDPTDYNCDGATLLDDRDGDGATACTDCDDGAATVYPGASELCDDRDNDCDGPVDEYPTDGLPWYLDGDLDGFGGDGVVVACDAPPDSYAESTDCDDTNAAIFPGADEVCDHRDNDCDGYADVDAVDAHDWYEDLDGDGAHGTFVVHDCDGGDELSTTNVDCDDLDATTFPGAAEYCDEVDHDCDGDPDVDSVDALPWYFDNDGDGAGGALDRYDCNTPVGDVATDGDCDDADATRNPTAVEVCNELDDDCDGLTDDEDSVSGAPAWFVDADGDGFGGLTTVNRCVALAGEYASAEDCDDGDAAVSPDGVEVCGGADEDCDGLTDDADPTVTGTHAVYEDADGDGYGVDSAPTQACVAPAGWGETTDDCDDSNAAISPGAQEVCSGVDEDCDALVDDADDSLDPASTTSWYSDADGDGFGATEVAASCVGPDGALAMGGDCDDADAAISPGAVEVCAGTDEDCDGLLDDEDEVSDGAWYYRDRDGDGVGEDAWAWCADPGEGYSTAGGDCDDTDDTISSGCAEPTFTESFDVVVIGSGPAGTSTALTAAEMGANVLLLERAEQAGEGVLAGQGLFGAGTRYQTADGIPDSVDDAIADWEDITGEPGETESVRNYVEATDEVIAWIASYGVPIDSIDDRDDTGPVARTHVIVSKDETTGRPIMVEAFSGELRTQVEVTGPVMWEGEVVGVRTLDLVTGDIGTIGADAVVLATGGFQRDAALVDEVLPGLSSRDFVYECIPDADGGGVPFTDLVGAAYFNRENLGIYSHAVHDPYGGDHDGLTWYGSGQGIVVGEDGERFASETELSSFKFWYVAPEGTIFSIVDADVVASATFSRPFYNWTTGAIEELSFDELYTASDEIFYANSVADLATAAGIDPTGLQTSIEDYNRSLLTGEDPFGRDLSHAEPLQDPDWYAFPLYFGIAKSFGGVQTDVAAGVLDEDGVAIPGLYAAGEVAGMIPGGGGGIGWGGSVSGCYYGGRVAGQEAATYALSR